MNPLATTTVIADAAGVGEPQKRWTGIKCTVAGHPDDTLPRIHLRPVHAENPEPNGMVQLFAITGLLVLIPGASVIVIYAAKLIQFAYRSL